MVNNLRLIKDTDISYRPPGWQSLDAVETAKSQDAI